MPRRYSSEFKERALRLVDDHQRAHECGSWTALAAVGEQLGVSPHTLRGWKRRDHAPTTEALSEPEDLQAENARLRREVLELRRANEILKTASAFFAAELDRPTPR